MIMYLTIVIISYMAITMLNCFIGGMALVTTLYLTLLAILLEVAVNAVVTLIMAKCLPDKCYSDRCKIYHVSRAEVSFFKFIRVNAWKDLVLELGSLGGFSKKSVTAPSDPKYVEKFILEINKGMLVHIMSAVACFTIIWLPFGTLSINLPVAIVACILNLLSLIVLRYNKPRFMILYRRLSRMQQNTSTKDGQDAK